MAAIGDLLQFIDGTVREYPRADQIGDAGCRHVFTRLRIRRGIAMAHPGEELRDGCKQIAQKYGCEFYADDGDWVIEKPYGSVGSTDVLPVPH